jgi:hypothetical protein
MRVGITRLFAAKQCCGLWLLVCLAWSLPASAALDVKKSCQDHVQRFYNYYLHYPNDPGPMPTEMRVIKEKKYAFSAQLEKLLRADYEASAKVSGEIVGLDFDPFTASQEELEHYSADKVTLLSGKGKKTDSYLVDVYSVRGGKKEAKPAVIPELVNEQGKWVFVNFHYGKTEFPENENLISVLKALAKSRLQPAK